MRNIAIFSIILAIIIDGTPFRPIDSNKIYNASVKIIQGDTGYLDELSFSEQSKNDIKEQLSKNVIHGYKEVIDSEIKFVRSKNSSCGDIVALVDLKVRYEEYTILYLIEYHIRTNREVYGVNVWAY